MTSLTSNVIVDPDISLPNETWAAIFNHLSPSSLVVLSGVSLHFNTIAERALYSSIFIVDVLSKSSPTPQKTLRWCQSMLRRKHLQDLTKRLHIRWQADQLSPPSPYPAAAVYDALSQVVRLLSALESLELFLGPTNFAISLETVHTIEQIIQGCQFSQLHSCSLGAEWGKGLQFYTSILTSFLCSLPNLRHLILSDHHTALNLPSEALPYLTTFRGSPDTAASLLPGRPVQCLSLIGHDFDVNRDNLPRMTYTSKPLKSLDLSCMSARPLLLRNVSTHLPTIKNLRVNLALRHTLHHALSGIRILSGLSAVLCAFNQLSVLDLSPTGKDGVGRADSLDELALCTEWCVACPSLRRIIFPFQSEWVFDANTPALWSLVQN
ncbi:hypothetical protein K443DRAFT_673060 [Laccaria amethystina LaAM-08-1]|uniref:F-box domain-containing protein n=1 Tax=Laccaria amethystina LaAM-08-1 TaxID=1095629 RepID=A0A0C9Y1M4_9AGAR|nr:hypothetical protein K443DRAFT_673060 [Laccaria amethystina LaAM-08-1]